MIIRKVIPPQSKVDKMTNKQVIQAYNKVIYHFRPEGLKPVNSLGGLSTARLRLHHLCFICIDGYNRGLLGIIWFPKELNEKPKNKGGKKGKKKRCKKKKG